MSHGSEHGRLGAAQMPRHSNLGSPTMPEIWKPVPEFDDYEVSNLGRVRSLTAYRKPRITPMLVKPRLQGMPGRLYYTVRLHRGGRKGYTRGVHRLVLHAFKGAPPPGDYEAAHLDGDKLHNTPDNLAWKTPKENADDKARHDVQPRGERVVTSKLTAEQVRGVLRSSESHAAVARAIGVTAGYVCSLRVGRWWRHVYDEVGGWVGKP